MNTGMLKYDYRRNGDSAVAGTRKKTFLARSRARRELSAEDMELVKAVLDARDEWIETGINFEHVHEELLVDYYSYKLKACEAKYTYFIRLAKERGLSNYI